MVNIIRLVGILFALATVLVTPLVPSASVLGAPLPVDLQLDGAGSEPWDISNIKPGDSGVKMITLRNAGYTSGVLTIWVSDIVDSQWISMPDVPVDSAEPEQLSRHLLFGLISNRLSANLALPAMLPDFPQSAADNVSITISPIAAGETIDLIWQWQLPPTAGNAVQGKKLSFSINYMLEEMPVVPVYGGGGIDDVVTPTPSATSTFTIISPEKQTALVISEDGTITETQTITVISDRVTLSFERGTRIITADNSIPTELRIIIKEEEPPLPDDIVYVGSVYELLYYVGGVPQTVTLSQPARIVLNYDLMSLPPGVSALFLATYDNQLGWIQLEPISGSVAEEGQIGALVNHFSMFTILAQIEPEGPVITPSVPSLLPARFELNNLTLSAQQVMSGDPVTVTAFVVNTGELSGEYLITLKANGLFVNSRFIRLAPGQNRNVSFVISPYAPGVYEIEVNGVSETLVVLENIVNDTGRSYWPVPVLPVIIGVIGFSLILGFTYHFNKKRK